MRKNLIMSIYAIDDIGKESFYVPDCRVRQLEIFENPESVHGKTTAGYLSREFMMYDC